MGKKFNYLNVPSHWKHYWTKYPEGYTILEALLNWVAQVDKMVDNINDWNEYLDDFVMTFDKDLQGKVVDTLREWQESGFLDIVIDEALQTQMDVIETDVDERGVNVKKLGAKGDGVSDDSSAILSAINLGKRIYFPEGTYILKVTDIDLLKGTVFQGDGAGKSIIRVDAPTSSYLFRLNLYSGFKDIRISFKNRFDGDAIVLDAGYVSKENNGVDHFQRNYILENVDITFPFKSGYGNGLTIKVKNYDDNNVTYSGHVRHALLYFYMNNVEVAYGNKAINIMIDQKEPVINRSWMTASRFSKIRANSCVYGIYFNVTNNSNTGLLDISDILFSDVEIQCQPENYFDSTTKATLPIYIKSTDRLVLVNFNNLTIWDSSTGISGYLDNARVNIKGLYLGFGGVKRGTNYKKGFELVNGATVDADVDVYRYRLTVEDGTETEINPIPGGIKFINDPEGTNGYSAVGKLYEKEVPNTLYSTVHLEAFDKNGVLEAYLEMGQGTGFKGDKHQGIFNLMARHSDGTMRSVVNKGYENTLYNTPEQDKGFYAGNGMYIKYERARITVEPSTNFQTIDIPIKEKYTYVPFLINCNLEVVDEGYSGSPVNVVIRQAQVTDKQNLRIVIKHDKETSLELTIGYVVCGYKTFTTEPE